MSKVADLQKAQQAITHPGSSLYVGAELFSAINKALAVAGPTGAPATIRERAKAYAETAKAYGKASTDLATVATDKLPNVWTGSVAEHATQAIQALANELTVSQKALEQASTALNTWADDLEGAQSTDAQGITALENVQKSLAHDIFDLDKAIAAIEPANTAVATRISAAQRAESSGGHAASVLNQLAAKARTERAGRGSLDPLAALVMANEKGPGASADGDYILTPDQLSRATQILDVMNGTDQAAFRGLLSSAKSPEEAAYLWKALAAGHSVTEVQQFAALIHPHGEDPVWLSQHLVPALRSDSADRESTTQQVELTYQGQELPGSGQGSIARIFGQGSVNDCVAASTGLAHLKLDPVTMLRLTTGNTPEVPGADSPSNFSQRLQDFYIGRFQQGQLADGSKPYPEGGGGLGDKGTRLVVDQNLAATGDTYENVSLKTDDDRRAALVRIEKALDEGKPVPLATGDGTGFHEMVIMARDGDRLQVWNPWGWSEWVTEDQFIHSHLNDGRLTNDSHLDKAYGVELPR